MNVAFITGKRQASHMQYGELAAVLHLSSISTKGLSQQKKKKACRWCLPTADSLILLVVDEYLVTIFYNLLAICEQHHNLDATIFNDSSFRISVVRIE